MHDERYQEIAIRDHDAEKIAKFDQVYTKLMGDPDDQELDQRYIGKRRLASQPSLNKLKFIQAKYEPTEMDEKRLDSLSSKDSYEDEPGVMLDSIASHSTLPQVLNRVPSDPSYLKILE